MTLAVVDSSVLVSALIARRGGARLVTSCPWRAHPPAQRTSVSPLLAGAELLQRPLGVLDGCGVVAEERAGHRPPAGAER
jgi:hypothetical protein